MWLLKALYCWVLVQMMLNLVNTDIGGIDEFAMQINSFFDVHHFGGSLKSRNGPKY